MTVEHDFTRPLDGVDLCEGDPWLSDVMAVDHRSLVGQAADASR